MGIVEKHGKNSRNVLYMIDGKPNSQSNVYINPSLIKLCKMTSAF
jgi:hypothetical protein